MTDKELRRLTRTDLLDLLIIERQEIDRLLEEQSRITARRTRFITTGGAAGQNDALRFHGPDLI